MSPANSEKSSYPSKNKLLKAAFLAVALIGSTSEIVLFVILFIDLICRSYLMILIIRACRQSFLISHSQFIDNRTNASSSAEARKWAFGKLTFHELFAGVDELSIQQTDLQPLETHLTQMLQRNAKKLYLIENK